MPTRSKRTLNRSKAASTANLPKPPSLLRTIGPSFILLGLALGSGELILWPFLAANWGLGLLWGGLLGISFQFVLNTEVMRYSLAWGESVFMGFRRLSILIPVWYIFSTFIPWSLPGFSSASSQILVTLVPWLPESVVAVGLLMLTGIIISAGKSLVRTMEVFQRAIIFIGLPFILLLTALITSSQDWLEFSWGLVGRGSTATGEIWWFFPEGVALASFLGAFAYSGAGGNLNLAQSYYIKEKGFGMGKYGGKITSLMAKGNKNISLEGKTFADTPANNKLWQRWWRLINQEHFIVFFGLGFLMISVLSVLAKATVYGTAAGEGLSFLYAEAAAIGTQTAPIFGTMFLLVAALMLFSTQVGVLESSSRIISENVLLLFYEKGRKFDVSKWFYLALWGQIGFGIIIYLSGFTEPRLLLTLGAILNAVGMMSSFILIAVLNRVRLRAELRPGIIRQLFLVAAVVFFLFFLVITGHSYLG
jgi:hypothetical protein